MKPEVIRCPSCGRKRTRSNNANARYWLLLHRMAEQLKPQGVSYSPETWHLWAKSKWLGLTDVTLPNGKVVHQAKNSSDLPADAFADYMMAVERYANEHGVWLDSLETLT